MELMVDKNDKILKVVYCSSTKIVDNVIPIVYTWFTLRGKKGGCNWT